MRALRRIYHRLTGYFTHRHREAELSEECKMHVDLLIPMKVWASCVIPNTAAY